MEYFENDNKKDISINWWGDEKPNEFKDKIYDNRTEIFFIGKLFQTILEDIETSFKYKSLLKIMLSLNYDDRISSFQEIDKNINNNNTTIYQNFRQTFFNTLVNRKLETTLIMDSEKIIKELEILQKKIMLEDYISAKHILRIFLQGSFIYNKNYQYNVDNISDFLIFFKKISKEKQNIVLYNIETLLDDVEVEFDDDEIPF
jgi:serine/threonine-protein kinase